MQTLWSVLDFLAKAVIVVAAFGACVAILASRARRRREGPPSVRLVEIGAGRRRRTEELKIALLPAGERKAAIKAARARAKTEASGTERQRNVFVIDFDGDLRATAVESLREEVTAVLGAIEDQDEVVIRLESPGGTVHGYGLAASQLARLRTRGIPLTVCVDKVAASGGYLMACVAPRIVAAPFAILGSIGVVAAVPNAHRALGRLGIDYTDVTAGEHKRTVSLFGPLREEGLAKLKEQVGETHELFKSYVQSMRPGLDVASVATGEHWHGTRALELGLCDELGTSDNLLLTKSESARVFEVHSEARRSVRDRLARAMSVALGWVEAR